MESLTERAAWRQVRELRQRAAAAGIGADEVEEARDGDDPKTALIALIVSHHRGEAERRRKVRARNAALDEVILHVHVVH